MKWRPWSQAGRWNVESGDGHGYGDGYGHVNDIARQWV